jgi:GNAT superfamily N-acetyltransferase
MKVEIKSIFDSQANADTLRKMSKLFAEGYVDPDNNYSCKIQNLNSKQHRELCSEDIKNGNAFWIMVDDKKAGYVLAPEGHVNTTNPNDKLRYLDTRFLLPEYQGKGIGSIVLDQLIKYHNVTFTCLHYDQVMEYQNYYASKGFELATVRAVFDPNFMPELLMKQKNPHMFLIHKSDPEIEQVRQKYSHINITTGEWINPTPNLEAA